MPKSSKRAFVERAVNQIIRQTPIGNQMVTEENLARDLRCARNTVRLALSSYMEQGIIVRHGRQGTIVVRHPDNQPDDVMLEIWNDDLKHKGPQSWTWWEELVKHGPDLRVVQHSRTHDTMRARMLACGAMRASAVPSIAAMEASELMEQVAFRAAADMTEPLKLLPNWQDIEPWAWPLVSQGGRVWGIPAMTYAYGLWVERSALAQCNLESHLPETWDDFIESLRTIQRATGRALAGTPISDSPMLISTLTGLAGGKLQHGEESISSAKTERAVGMSFQFYSDLIHKHEFVKPSIVFGYSPWKELRQRTFGFFHGTVPLPQAPPSVLTLDDYLFWPIPPAKLGIPHRYPVTMHAIAFNRRLTHEQRMAALRFVDMTTSEEALRETCRTQGKVFLCRTSQWRWAESPSWLRNISAGWNHILCQPLTRISTPAGYQPTWVTNTYGKVLSNAPVP